MERKCEQCNELFNVNEKRKRERVKRFCSGTCAKRNTGLKNGGRKHSDDINKRKGLSGELNPFYGKSHSANVINTIKQKKLIRDLENVKSLSLSNYEYEVLDGIMISDGSISDVNNVSGRISLGFKYDETLTDIETELSSIEFTKHYHSKRTKCYHNKSRMYDTLLEERNRWYREGVKFPPKDFRLTSTSCYWWFICDGYTSRGNVFLCTDSYKRVDIITLVDRFNDNGFRCSITSHDRIRFYKKSSTSFLKWITPVSGVHKQYEYKWELN